MMEAITKEKKRKSKPIPGEVFKKMLADKKAVSTHIKNGGSFEDLKKKGYKFATV